MTNNPSYVFSESMIVISFSDWYTCIAAISLSFGSRIYTFINVYSHLKIKYEKHTAAHRILKTRRGLSGLILSLLLRPEPTSSFEVHMKTDVLGMCT